MEMQVRSRSALDIGTEWTFVHSLIQNTWSQQPAHLWASTSFLELFINCRAADIHRVLPYKVTGITTIQAQNSFLRQQNWFTLV